MERGKTGLLVAGVVIIFGITAGGIGWHNQSVAAAQAAALQSRQAAQAAQQAQATAEAAEARDQAQKMAAIDAAQKRVEAGMVVKARQEQAEVARAGNGRVHVVSVPGVVETPLEPEAPNDDPDAKILPDDDKSIQQDFDEEDAEHQARVKADDEERRYQNSHLHDHPTW